MDQPGDYLDRIFDFSFTEFITIRMIKILYGIGITLSAIGALRLIIGGFADSFGKGVLYLIISPAIFLVYVIIARVFLEIIVALLRIAEHVGEIGSTLKK